MTTMSLRLTAALAGVVLATSVISAQQAARPAAVTKAAKQDKTLSQAGSLISGVAVDSERVPVRRTTIRLRNLKVNGIERVATTNDLGEFSFAAQPEIPYVVEVADPAGRVLGVGDVILISPGEVASTVVVLPSTQPSAAGGFGETASSVIATMIGAGLTIVDPLLPKVSPEE
jgi:hypothetical protein